MFLDAKIPFFQRLYSKLGIEGHFHQADSVALGVFGDVDVGLHGLVVGVSGEFHHDVRRNAVGEGETDEGLAAGMGADELVLGIDFVVA